MPFKQDTAFQIQINLQLLTVLCLEEILDLCEEFNFIRRLGCRCGFFFSALLFLSELANATLKCVDSLAYVGAGILTIITIAMVVWNRMRIQKEENKK